MFFVLVYEDQDGHTHAHQSRSKREGSCILGEHVEDFVLAGLRTPVPHPAPLLHVSSFGPEDPPQV